MMTIAVFSNADKVCSYSSVFLLSASPIVGGGVASFAYAIATRGTYLITILVCELNRVKQFFCRTNPLLRLILHVLLLVKHLNPHG